MSECLGQSRELPTNGGVLRAAYYLCEQGVTAKEPEVKNFGKIEKPLVGSVIACWLKASIPQRKTRPAITLRERKLNETYIRVRKVGLIVLTRCEIGSLQSQEESDQNS